MNYYDDAGNFYNEIASKKKLRRRQVYVYTFQAASNDFLLFFLFCLVFNENMLSNCEKRLISIFHI